MVRSAGLPPALRKHQQLSLAERCPRFVRRERTGRDHHHLVRPRRFSGKIQLHVLVAQSCNAKRCSALQVLEARARMCPHCVPVGQQEIERAMGCKPGCQIFQRERQFPDRWDTRV